jgi:serine/threonine-protein kinase
MKLLVICICVTYGCCSARSAAAQASIADKAAAEVLFERGRQLSHDGRFAEACARLEQSQSIEPSLGTMLYLGDCYEKLGRSASAWALYVEASSQAAAAGQSKRARAGRQRADLLEPSLSKLSIVVAPESDLPGLEILRNGVNVGHALWGVPVPVDPGDQAIEVRAPNREPWTTTLHVDAGGARVSANVPRLGEATARAYPAKARLTPSQHTAANVPPPLAASSLAPSDSKAVTGLEITAASAAAVGVVGLIVGGIFGLHAIAKNNAAKAYCKPGSGPVCREQAGVDLSRQANRSATAANILMIGGAGLLVGGAVLFFTGPAESPRSALGMAISPRRADLQWTGTF